MKAKIVNPFYRKMPTMKRFKVYIRESNGLRRIIAYRTVPR